MDIRFSAEQQDLVDTVSKLAGQLGPDSVHALDDTGRRERLARAANEAGLLQLRESDGTGAPVASGVEVGIVAEQFGRKLVDTPFLGPTLAAEAFRLAGADNAEGMTIALDRSGSGPAVWLSDGTLESLVIDADAGDKVLGFVADGDSFTLAVADVGDAESPIDLTRRLSVLGEGKHARPLSGAALSRADVDRLGLLGQVIVCKDLAGIAAGVQSMTTEYAKVREQYGTTIGSFQAVQHALAEVAALVEGATSIALFAAWSLDAVDAVDAQRTARIAKAFCEDAARKACETAVQVHGGIGNTWECVVHLYVRRYLHSAELFGSGGHQLECLASELLSVGG